ncbi:YtrH family sporulation protein [Fictibacillus sp. WQ 8-8]|uniref:YtrH family sporulation protein n=2 Tax=Fictibacillus TaxID=1329200 RepID=A0A9X2BDN1_9BACL|nr:MULTISPECIES: YtrH family sporulation protein [Fictibacillus]SFD59004.1 Sporulation protein YtrH [Bacillus sp. OV194]MCK6258039.1 YtrH family sporulation protein [Fictibacillus marinisediminis]MCQ6266561.1 YtrH family sporulation protein [Fictibacillus sp. WQ 8-8]MDN4072618.1 YtrH family sporulation protein [Fictibacillus sp. CENA-BCM004]MED2971506.1 YtrH family sporulation protein [Fictibacillus sp. B-59209]
MRDFLSTIIITFFIAFGVILGGAIIGGLASFLVGKAPLMETVDLAKKLKIWAIVAAMGGTFDTITNFERSFLNGATYEIVKQLVIIFIAMAGANTAMLLLQWLTQENLN